MRTQLIYMHLTGGRGQGGGCAEENRDQNAFLPKLPESYKHTVTVKSK